MRKGGQERSITNYLQDTNRERAEEEEEQLKTPEEEQQEEEGQEEGQQAEKESQPVEKNKEEVPLQLVPKVLTKQERQNQAKEKRKQKQKNKPSALKRRKVHKGGKFKPSKKLKPSVRSKPSRKSKPSAVRRRASDSQLANGIRSLRSATSIHFEKGDYLGWKRRDIPEHETQQQTEAFSKLQAMLQNTERQKAAAKAATKAAARRAQKGRPTSQDMEDKQIRLKKEEELLTEEAVILAEKRDKAYAKLEAARQLVAKDKAEQEKEEEEEE